MQCRPVTSGRIVLGIKDTARSAARDCNGVAGLEYSIIAGVIPVAISTATTNAAVGPSLQIIWRTIENTFAVA